MSRHRYSSATVIATVAQWLVILANTTSSAKETMPRPIMDISSEDSRTQKFEEFKEFEEFKDRSQETLPRA